MREDEELCKHCFDRYLVDKLGSRGIRWRPGDEPPDYYLNVESREFAVEIRGLVGRTSTDSGSSISDIGYSASVKRLCERIQTAATQEGILSGFYVIHFEGPFDHFGKAKKLVEKGALDYIEYTQSRSNAPWCMIFAPDRAAMKKVHITPDEIASISGASARWMPGSCSIKKFGSSRDLIAETLTARDWSMWEGEMLAQACSLLQEAICEKKDKLKHITMVPKILLLLDQWPLAEPLIYQRCIGRVDFLDSFHSIFIVESQNEGYFVQTQERSWRPSFDEDQKSVLQ